MTVALLGAFAMVVTAAVDPDGQVTDGGNAISPDTLAAASEAGVSVIDLLGAMSTTSLTARQYLVGVGELVPPPSPKPVLFGAVARAQCLITKESGGLELPNRQGSGATGPGQYFPSSWVRHVALYRSATGFTGPLSLHNYDDVLRVMAWILSAIPSSRSEWTVGGC